MAENQNSNVVNSNFDSFYYIALFYKYKWLIIVFVLVATGVSVFLALNMDNWYASTANLVPPKKEGSILESAAGNISSALKNIGLTKIGDKGGGVYSYLVILESRTVKDSIIAKYNLVKEYEMEDAKMEEVRKAFEDNIEVSFEGEGNYFLTIYDKDPQKATMMVKDYVQFANDIAQRLNHEEGIINVDYIESRIKNIDERYKAAADSLALFSRKYSMIAPEQQAQAVLSSLSNLKAEMIKQEVTYEMMAARFGADDPYTLTQKELYDQMKNKVSTAETQAGFAGKFPLTKSAEIGMEYMRLYSEIETFIKVKAFLLPILEDTKLNEIKNQRNLYVVDEPIPADKKSRPKRSFIVAGTAVGSLILSMLFILCIHSFRNFKTRYKAIQL